ncbi:MAG: anti-sigma factor [Chloroflexota bacterium]|nr:anti-sigma factor [Chloroflexota bacterium]
MTNTDDEVALDSLVLRYRDGGCTAAERAHIECNPALLQRTAEIAHVDDTMRQLFRMPVPVEDQLSPEELVAFAMDALDEPRRAQLAQRARSDPLLQAEVDLIRALGPNPLLEPRSASRPAALRREVMPPVQPRPEPPRAPLWRWPLPWQRVRSLALTGVAVVCFAWGLAQQAQIAQLRATAARNSAVAKAAFGNPDAQERRLEPTAAAPGAWGRVLISPSAPALVLYVKNLPPLPSGQVYQIWLMQRGQALSLGTFTVDQDGRAWQLIQPPAPVMAPQRISITIEPVGGSAQPTGPEYLGNRF